MTIALTGGTGFVGQAVIECARQRGLELRALTRRPQQAREGLDWVCGTLSDRPALERLVDGAETVVHVAGIVKAKDAQAFEDCNVTGTLDLVEAAVAAGVPRIVFVSSLAAREPQLSVYGASKARAEKIVAASGMDWTIVRPPAVYGPRDTEMFELFRAARWGVLPMPPRGRSSVIHVDDLARLLITLAPGGEAVSHQTFEPDDGRVGGWTHGELARAIGFAVGGRPWTPHLSPAILRALARLDEGLRRGKARLTRDRVNYLVHPDWVVGSERAIPSDIWKPEIVTRDGLKTTARWYRENGWL